MKQARRAEPPKVARVIPMSRTSKASLSLVVDGVIIRLDSGFDVALRREVIPALKGELT